MGTTDNRTIKSAERVFDMFEAIRERGGATLTELAEDLDLAPSTAHQYLSTLQEREFVVKTEGEFNLSHRFLDYGEYVRQRGDIYELAKQKVQQLAEETGERGQFSVPEHGRVVVLHTEVGEQAVKAGVRAGQRLPLHATAAGKAILAYYPTERVEEIIEQRGLDPVTENTITDRGVLFEELETIRERGVAYNDQEDTNRLRAVGAPVRNPDGESIGAVSISGPSHRLESPALEGEIEDLLRGTTNELELKIEYR